MARNFSSSDKACDQSWQPDRRMFEWWLDLFPGLLIGEAVSTESVAFLSWNTIRTWLQSRKLLPDDVGVLVRQSLSNGNDEIRCGVFNRLGDMREAAGWECVRLDEELATFFEEADEVLVRI
jgi:hypothetical protein